MAFGFVMTALRLLLLYTGVAFCLVRNGRNGYSGAILPAMPVAGILGRSVRLVHNTHFVR